MSAESIIATQMALLAADAGTSSYKGFDYWTDRISIDQRRTGTYEIDLDPTAETETRVDGPGEGLAHVEHAFRARLTKTTPGTPKDTRSALGTMILNFKNALDTANGNFGHANVRRNSVRWRETRLSPVAGEDGESSLHTATAILAYRCEEYQLAGSRA